MSVNIPIWPGSSSFTAGATPFGFFDSDTAFASQADKVAKWCAVRLGYPLSDIELQATHFYSCFEEATLEYSNQVNQFSIRDNMLLLQGSPSSANLTAAPVNTNLGRIIAIAKNYGTEAGSGGYLTYKTASINIIQNKQVYDIHNFNFWNIVVKLSSRRRHYGVHFIKNVNSHNISSMIDFNNLNCIYIILYFPTYL
jgi:hypothetical protein